MLKGLEAEVSSSEYLRSSHSILPVGLAHAFVAGFTAEEDGKKTWTEKNKGPSKKSKRAKGSKGKKGPVGKKERRKRMKRAKTARAQPDREIWDWLEGEALEEYPNAIKLVSSSKSRYYAELLEEAAGASLVAYDIQWSPDFDDTTDNKVALLQLAFPLSCNTYVLQLPLLGKTFPEAAQRLFESSDVLTVGFAASADRHKLEISGVKVDLHTLIDVQPWCEAEMGENSSVRQGWRVGLKRASRCVLDFEMEKTCTMASSNWERQELTTAQAVPTASSSLWRLKPVSSCLIALHDLCYAMPIRLGTFISLVTLGRGKLKAAFCPSVSLGKLSSGQVVPASPRPTDSEPCGCPDPIYGSDICYEPVCPPGYFRQRCSTVFSQKFPACLERRCCATCYEAPCYGLKKDLELSWRGIYECIQCEPGDFCNGCDTFTRCPDNTQPTREGPRVSRAGSTRIADCESCAAGMEASFKRDRCVAQYTHVCNEEFVQRCIRSCKAEEPARGKKLTACEQIKCEMYCAKQWSDECAQVVGDICRDLTTAKDSGVIGVDGMSSEVEILICDVDCNSSLRNHLAVLVSLLCIARYVLGI
eukprot:symbB.v1.2.030583.t1/scaffold3464.1/size56234/6